VSIRHGPYFAFPGDYSSLSDRGDAEVQVKGFKGAVYKSFKTLREAETYVGVKYIESALTKEEQLDDNSVPSTSVPSTSSRFRPYAKPESKIGAGRSGTSDSLIVVYTDGACRGNGQPGSVAGIGVWYGVNDAR
jgi:ribonuclease HI